ncbi:capsid cement protein [Mycobacterium sp. NPDC050853]|uniref:capsid cement protein n=1 Tax=Mycobacterium sp. NPDC050853 TaxID=3155160 RepID=UPI0033E4E403
MGIYAPNYFPAERLDFTAGAAITAGQLVYISAPNTVLPTSAATIAWVGAAAHDAASGTLVTVLAVGVHTLAASGAITAGANVVAAAAGAVADLAAGTNYAQVVGVALTTAAGNLVTVLFR